MDMEATPKPCLKLCKDGVHNHGHAHAQGPHKAMAKLYINVIISAHLLVYATMRCVLAAESVDPIETILFARSTDS